jgi:translation initiation factor 2 subunit 3
MCENDIADFNVGEITEQAHEAGLSKQDFWKLDMKTLDAATFEVMSRQATINIGTIGHVAHGKSTVVKAMSGVRTTKFKKEAIMNITIHLGYANAKIFKCEQCEAPKCYQAFGSKQADETKCGFCGNPLKLVRHVSFVDCPGHDVLMATMLNGAAIMDAALLLIAANESFPQPQTLEHLKAVEIMKLRNIIVLQNKIDLVKDVPAKDQFQQIRSYLESTIGLTAPILPISAQLKYNVDALLEYIAHIPLPIRSFDAASRMTVVRSFDVNKPGDNIDSLCGGVAGGSVLQGILKVKDEVEVRPGLIHNHGGGQFSCTPIRTRVETLMAESNPLQYAIPGGLIAVGTTLDPTLTRQNKLVGQIIGQPGSLPEVFCEIDVHFFLLSQLVGVVKKNSGARTNEKTAVKINKLMPEEMLQINVGTLTAGATVVSVTTNPDFAKLQLVTPVCCSIGEQIAISRRVDKHFRLIGWGTIRRGAAIILK